MNIKLDSAVFSALQKIADNQADHDRLMAISRRAMTTPLFDIDSLDPLNHRKVSSSDTGHDERAEHEDRDQDYDKADGGMRGMK
jgi:hypothetical protein